MVSVKNTMVCIALLALSLLSTFAFALESEARFV